MTMPFDPRRSAEYPPAVGCDEVGRGALCGPVVVAAVWFDPTSLPADVLGALNDSKKIPGPTRELLAPKILRLCRVAFAASSSAAIDRVGIRPATLDAMRRAILALANAGPAYVDGRDTPPGLDCDCTPLVRGETLVPQIAASSIVAKIFRDRVMRTLSLRYPAYKWDRNSGYGTSDHLEALQRFGPTRHHRASFEPVARLHQLNSDGHSRL